MFSIQINASKVALVHLVARLWRGGFTLLDTQFVNNHLMQFGVYEITYDEYMKELKSALAVKDANFTQAGIDEDEIISDYLDMRKAKDNAPHDKA